MARTLAPTRRRVASPTPPPTSPAMAGLLDSALRSSHVTAAELADELEVPTATLNAWRYGRRTLPPAMRAKLAVVLLRRAEEMRRAAERFAAAVTAPEDGTAA